MEKELRLVNRILIAIILFLLGSCSASWHANRALKKDPSIKTEFSDTNVVQFTYVDTVYTSDTTFYLNVRQVDSAIVTHYQKYDFSGLKTWFQTWQEEKTDRTEIRNIGKTDRTVVKQENKTERHQATQDRKVQNNTFKILFIVVLLLFIGLLFVLAVKKYVLKK